MHRYAPRLKKIIKIMELNRYTKHLIEQDDIDAVTRVLRSDYLMCGPRVEELETAFAEYTGAKYCIATTSGCMALYLAYGAIMQDSFEDWTLVVPANTFVATRNAYTMQPYGCDKHVYVEDVKLIDGNLKTNLLYTDENLIIAPVHIGGNSCDMDKIMLKNDYQYVVEDAAHAIGAEYKGSKVGSCEFSDICCFSLGAPKNITCGEGGLITTNDRELYEKMYLLRRNGRKRDKRYDIDGTGLNLHMSEINAALALSQLKKLDRYNDERRFIAQRYTEAFSGLDNVVLPEEGKNCKSSWHLYQIMTYGFELENTIKHYPPLEIEEIVPVAHERYKHIHALPCYPGMTQELQEKVIKYVLEKSKESSII